MTRLDVVNAKTKELVDFYNEHAEKPVKRFATRAAAEKRVLALFDQGLAVEEEDLGTDIDDLDAVDYPENKKVVEKVAHSTANDEDGSRTDGWKSKLAKSIHESWKVEETAMKRKERSAVIVDGEEYPSVAQAFIELDLPMKKVIKFRMRLKKEIELDEYGYHWTIVPLNYKEAL